MNTIKYPYLTLLASFTLILVSIYPLLHNIAYFNGVNLLGMLGVLTGTLGIILVQATSKEGEK